MATTMPTAVDVFTNPAPSDPLTGHSTQHTHVNDAVKAIEALVVGSFLYNAKGYGAKGDGATDDTAAIQAALTAAGAAGGGTVFLPEGIYFVTPPSLTVPALTVPTNVTIQGNGPGGTVISKRANGIALDFSGSATMVHNINQGLRDIRFAGNSHTGAMIRLWYVNFLDFRNVQVYNNSDVAFSFLECWDSRFYNLYCGSCGSTTSALPNLLFQNSVAASGFGFSGDNNNQLFFYSVDLESFYSGAISIIQGVSNSNNPNGIVFDDLKMESGNIGFNTPVFQTDTTCLNIRLSNVYMFIGGYNGGYSTPTIGINFLCGEGSIDGLYIGNTSVQGITSGLVLDNRNQQIVARKISGFYAVQPTQHVLITGNGSGTVALSDVNSNATTNIAMTSTVANQPSWLNFTPTSHGYIAYAATITPNPFLASFYYVDILTGAMTVAAPSNQWEGATLTLRFQQDGTGGRVITWNAIFKKNLTGISTAANSYTTVSFVFDSVNWIQTAFTTGVV